MNKIIKYKEDVIGDKSLISEMENHIQDFFKYIKENCKDVEGLVNDIDNTDWEITERLNEEIQSWFIDIEMNGKKWWSHNDCMYYTMDFRNIKGEGVDKFLEDMDIECLSDIDTHCFSWITVDVPPIIKENLFFYHSMNLTESYKEWLKESQ